MKRTVLRTMVAFGAIAALAISSPAFACATQGEIDAAAEATDDAYQLMIEYDQATRVLEAGVTYEQELMLCSQAPDVPQCMRDKEDNYMAALDLIYYEYSNLWLTFSIADGFELTLRANACPT